MDYSAFSKLEDKPSGMTCPSPPLNGSFPLDFGGEELLPLLDDFSSFEDLMDDIGIEDSWEADFSEIFPDLQPLASVDMDAVTEFDSYAEFLLLVDTKSPDHPVYWFSAEWWDWDEWEKSQNGFTLLAASFSEFFDSLTKYEG